MPKLRSAKYTECVHTSDSDHLPHSVEYLWISTTSTFPDIIQDVLGNLIKIRQLKLIVVEVALSEFQDISRIVDTLASTNRDFYIIFETTPTIAHGFKAGDINGDYSIQKVKRRGKRMAVSKLESMYFSKY